MTEITRHFTVSCYIVFNKKALLHKHRKYGKYLPVGGHIDRDETPEEAVLREVKEESGLDIELFSNKLKTFSRSKEMNIGNVMNLHNVNTFHQHMDFVYFAKSVTDKVNPREGESKDLIWVSVEDFENIDTYEEVKDYCIQAIERFS